MADRWFLDVLECPYRSLDKPVIEYEGDRIRRNFGDDHYKKITEDMIKQSRLATPEIKEVPSNFPDADWD